jgi:hypothetical protein
MGSITNIEKMQMTRAFQKHIARRQDQTFAGWFPELKKLAGESWADVADQAQDRGTVGQQSPRS